MTARSYFECYVDNNYKNKYNISMTMSSYHGVSLYVGGVQYYMKTSDDFKRFEKEQLGRTRKNKLNSL